MHPAQRPALVRTVFVRTILAHAHHS